MTYKSTQQNLDHIHRVASASTRESPSGRIDAIPSWAQAAEDYFNSIKERWLSVLKQVDDTQNRLSDLNFRLKATMPIKEYELVKRQRDDLATKISVLQARALDYRVFARNEAKNSWAITFYYICEKLLDKEQMQMVSNETRALLDRAMTDGIDPGQSKHSAEYNHRHTRRKNRNDSLENIRNKERHMIYSTNGGFIKVKDRK